MGKQLQQVTQYIDTVFTKRLKEEGFVSRDSNHIHWYRVVGENIVQSVIFHTIFPSENHIFLSVGYGIHPLFIRPYYRSSVCLNGALSGIVPYFMAEMLMEPWEDGENPRLGLGPYSREISVMCPMRGGRGVYTFDQVLLPAFEQIQTVEQAYAYHINLFSSPEEAPDKYYRLFSPELICEAIYLGDESKYAICQKRLREIIDGQALVIKGDTSMQPDKRIKYCQLLLATIENGDRSRFLEMIQQSEQKNRQELETKVGIRLD